jgi:hypothetical protein
MCPRAGLEAVEKGKSLVPAGNRTSAVQPLARFYTDLVIQAPTISMILFKELSFIYTALSDLKRNRTDKSNYAAQHQICHKHEPISDRNKLKSH